MEGTISLLIIVMLLSGSFGGIINFFLTRRAEPEDSSIWKSLTVGIGASFLVPLFLNMISSNLVEAIRGSRDTPGDSSKLLVFAGFCLVASISSTAFIRTLSDRILSEAKAARKEAEQAKEEVQQVQAAIDPLIEREPERELTADNISSTVSRTELDDIEKSILIALRDSRYTLRSVGGIAQEIRSARDSLEDALSRLELKGLAGSRQERRGVRWYITQKGLEAISA